MKFRTRAELGARRAFELLPDSVRGEIRKGVGQFSGVDQLKRNQAMLAMRVGAIEAAQASGRADASGARSTPASPTSVRSRICTQAQLEADWYPRWCAELGQPVQFHRKLWEHAYLQRALDDLGMLGPGRRGLGFGVGREPLVAYLAGRGCTVVATDLAADEADARVWSNTDQHVGSLEGLQVPALCPPEYFRTRVSWRPVDMRAIPDDLHGFDFCWSACCFEHLGSAEAGAAFVEASVRTLRPGGIAVHTTEFDLTDNDVRVSEGPTVLFPPRPDRGDRRARLEAQGHEVAAFDFGPGDQVLDDYVDLPPYVEEPHLRLYRQGQVVTSIGLVVRAGGRSGADERRQGSMRSPRRWWPAW